MVRAGECAAIWMSPRAWLLRCPPAAETEVVALVTQIPPISARSARDIPTGPGRE
jgi:hypothetical protein